MYGTKIVFDNVLGDHPLPQRLTRFVALPADRGQLLGIVAVAMVALAVACELVSLWSQMELDAGDAACPRVDPQEGLRPCREAAAASRL